MVELDPAELTLGPSVRETVRLASRDNLLRGAGRFLLGRPEAEAILDGVFATVRARWRDAMREAGVGPADVEQIASAFVHPWLTGVRPAGGCGARG